MKILEVYMQHPIMQLNTTFSYLYDGDVDVTRGCRCRVDFNGQKIVGFVDNVKEINDLESYQKDLGYTLKTVDEVIDQQPVLNDELYELGLWMSHNTVSPAISCFQAMLPSSLKPIKNADNIVSEKYVRIIDNSELPQYQVNQEIKLSLFKQETSEYKYKKYKDKGHLVVFDKEKEASYDSLNIRQDPFVLTDLQQKALQQIKSSTNNTILLHGLTGSGKTEIFIQLAKETILAGKQVLILVPEISLTPMMVERFKNRFASIAIYHSGLSNSQKYQQYQLIRENKVQIMIGTRSAVFAPFTNLGLIVMDEEHDNSYKQESQPKYNARDIALERSKHHNCKLILASATPSLESYARGIKNVYQLVSLDKRVHSSLATSHIIDMSKEIRQGNYIVSAPLLQALKDSLQKRKQAILLLNRRGYTPIVKCSSCNEVIHCPHCDVALSYHKDSNRMVCHCCGYSSEVVDTCPKCGHKTMKNYGVGTQRLVEEINNLLPDARVLRMDADMTSKKDSHQQILSSFEKGDYDILVGTQMIAKGLDFDKVNVVGIFNADAPLAHSDYRSVETTFDLIVQASGRSGRKEEGQVFVQAYDTSHYGIRLAVKQDYLAFFNSEMSYRHALKYPPYTYLASINYGSNDENEIRKLAFEAVEYFKQDSDIKVLGPSQLLKKMDQYRYRIILKTTDKPAMIDKIWQYYNSLNINRNKISVTVDIDPYVLD